jgi:hypothetical protein
MPGPSDADFGPVSTSVPPPGFTGGPSSRPRPEQQPLAQQQPTPPGPPRGRSRGLGKLVGGAGMLIGLGVLGFLLFGSAGSELSGPIAQAATVSSNAPGYRMHMSLQLSSSALPAPITGTGDAVVDVRDQATSMSFDIDFGADPAVTQQLGSSVMHMEMRADGKTVYVKLPPTLTSALPISGKQWIEVNLSKLGGLPGLSAIRNDPTTSDPSALLQYLRSQSATVTNEGQANVNGIETTHYRAQLDIAHLADSLPSAERSAVQSTLSEMQQDSPSGGIPVDVWVDSSHLVRKMTMSIDLAPPNGPTIDEVVTANLGDYGPQAPPPSPPAGDVLNLTNLANPAG